MPDPAPMPLPGSCAASHHFTAWGVALAPLVLIPLGWQYWNIAATNPGIIIARSGDLLLLAGCVLAVLLPPPIGRAWWRSPFAWLLGAVLWQGLAALFWCQPWEPALIRVAERASALALAAVIAIGWRGGTPWPLPVFGGAVLLLNVWNNLPALVTPFDFTTSYPPSLANPEGFNYTWNPITALGGDPLFGNTNFNVGGAMPMVMLGFGLLVAFGAQRLAGKAGERNWFSTPAGITVLVATLIGLVCGVVMSLGTYGPFFQSLGFRGVDAVASGVVGLVVGTITAFVLLLPRRWHLAVLLTLGLAFIGFQGFCTATRWLPKDAPSWVQRIYFWRSGFAAIAERPLHGFGPASSTETLTRRDDYNEAWLAVPSYPEHTHHEFLEAWVDGGLVLVVLLTGGTVLMLLPVWRRREEPECQALITGWTTMLAMSTLSSQLSQPGPLLLLAALGGMTWGQARSLGETGTEGTPLGARIIQPVFGLATAALVVVMVARDWDGGGSPPMVDFRIQREMQSYHRACDWDACVLKMQEQEGRQGPCDDIIYRQAFYARLAGDWPVAEEACLRQVQRLPVLPMNLALLETLAQRQRRLGQPDRAQVLEEALDRGLARALLAAQRVKPSGRTQELRQELDQLARRRGLSATAGSIP